MKSRGVYMNQFTEDGAPAPEDAPDIPKQDTDAEDWFGQARGLWPADSIILAAPFYNWVGHVNVETAQVAFATAYFEECEEGCTASAVDTNCGGCSRGPGNFISAASGTGDGAYPVLRLLDPQLTTVGVLTGFMNALDETAQAGRVAEFSEMFAASAPMVLGTLDCQGSLLVYEASKSLDDREVSVDVPVEPGPWTVVCWVRQPEFQADRGLFPVAIAALGGALRDEALRRVPELSALQRRALIEQLWGSGGPMVDSLMTDIREAVLQNNVAQSKGFDIAAASSYLAQLAEHFEDSGAGDVMRTMFGAGTSQVLEMLEWRGVLEPRLPWWTSEMASQPEDLWHQVRAAGDPTSPVTREVLASSRWARRVAAHRSDLAPELVAQLAADPDRRVRHNIAAGDATPAQVLAHLEGDPDAAVATAARSNPTRPTVAEPAHGSPSPAAPEPFACRDRSGEYLALVNVGDRLGGAGDLDLAELFTRRGISAAVEAGDRWAAATAANNLAFCVLIPQGRLDEARAVLRDAMALDAGYQSTNAMSNLGIVEYDSGDPAAASSLFQRVVDSGTGPLDEAHYYLGLIAKQAGEPAASQDHFRRAASGDDPEYAEKAKAELRGARRKWWH